MKIILTEEEIERIILDYINGSYNLKMDQLKWDVGMYHIKQVTASESADDSL
jgi:hypothetical protein